MQAEKVFHVSGLACNGQWQLTTDPLQCAGSSAAGVVSAKSLIADATVGRGRHGDTRQARAAICRQADGRHRTPSHRHPRRTPATAPDLLRTPACKLLPGGRHFLNPPTPPAGGSSSGPSFPGAALSVSVFLWNLDMTMTNQEQTEPFAALQTFGRPAEHAPDTSLKTGCQAKPTDRRRQSHARAAEPETGAPPDRDRTATRSAPDRTLGAVVISCSASLEHLASGIREITHSTAWSAWAWRRDRARRHGRQRGALDRAGDLPEHPASPATRTTMSSRRSRSRCAERLGLLAPGMIPP